MVGLLLIQNVVHFVDACAGSFLAPEVERDLSKTPNSSLIEAVNFHATSVSGWVFSCIRFIVPFLPSVSFIWNPLHFQAMLLARGL